MLVVATLPLKNNTGPVHIYNPFNALGSHGLHLNLEVHVYYHTVIVQQ